MSDWQGFSPLNDFTGPLLDNLKRHPKRIVFPEGEDVRVLRVSERFVAEQAGVPILLGRKEVIRRMAEMNGISLKFVRIIEPEKSSDLQMFCDRYERAEQMFGNGLPMNTREIVSEPVHFAAMMVLYGQADAIVAGNTRSYQAPLCHLDRSRSRICQKIRRPRHLLPGGYRGDP